MLPEKKTSNRKERERLIALIDKLDEDLPMTPGSPTTSGFFTRAYSTAVTFASLLRSPTSQHPSRSRTGESDPTFLASLPALVEQDPAFKAVVVKIQGFARRGIRNQSTLEAAQILDKLKAQVEADFERHATTLVSIRALNHCRMDLQKALDPNATK